MKRTTEPLAQAIKAALDSKMGPYLIMIGLMTSGAWGGQAARDMLIGTPAKADQVTGVEVRLQRLELQSYLTCDSLNDIRLFVGMEKRTCQIPPPFQPAGGHP